MKKNIAQFCFYEGQKVTPSHLNNLQSYSDAINSELVVNRLGFGVIEGFEVTKTSDLELTVTAGIAYAEDGERLILEQEKILLLNEYLPVLGSKKVIISITKDFIKENPVEDVTGTIVYTQWTPTVKCEITEYQAGIPAGYLRLAEVTLNSQGIIEIEQTSSEVPLKTNHDAVNINSLSLNWNGKAILDIIYPVGYQYTQYPNYIGEFEITSEPSTMFGGIWELRFNDKGLFFRTEGGNSSESRDGSTGIQGTAVQHHKHDVDLGGHDHKYGRSNGNNFGGGNYNSNDGHSHDFTTSWTNLGIKRSTDIVEGNRTSTETRPVNMLMRIWQRIS